MNPNNPCPNPRCSGEVVEVIDPKNDRRRYRCPTCGAIMIKMRQRLFESEKVSDV